MGCLVLTEWKAAKMFVNPCFTFHFSNFYVTGTEMNRMCWMAGEGGVLQTNQQIQMQIQSVVKEIWNREGPQTSAETQFWTCGGVESHGCQIIYCCLQHRHVHTSALLYLEPYDSVQNVFPKPVHLHYMCHPGPFVQLQSCGTSSIKLHLSFRLSRIEAEQPGWKTAGK